MKLTDGILIIIARLLIVIAHINCNTQKGADEIRELETKLDGLSKL